MNYQNAREMLEKATKAMLENFDPWEDTYILYWNKETELPVVRKLDIQSQDVRKWDYSEHPTDLVRVLEVSDMMAFDRERRDFFLGDDGVVPFKDIVRINVLRDMNYNISMALAQ